MSLKRCKISDAFECNCFNFKSKYFSRPAPNVPIWEPLFFNIHNRRITYSSSKPKIAQYTTHLKALYFSRKTLKKISGMVKIVNINDMSHLRKMAKFKLQFTSNKIIYFMKIRLLSSVTIQIHIKNNFFRH